VEFGVLNFSGSQNNKIIMFEDSDSLDRALGYDAAGQEDQDQSSIFVQANEVRRAKSRENIAQYNYLIFTY
jgi:hypothetical protein